MDSHTPGLPEAHPSRPRVGINFRTARRFRYFVHLFDKKRPPFNQPLPGNEADFEPPRLWQLLRAGNGDGNQILALVLDEPDAELTGEGFL